jgi:hypothetical protein
MTMKMRLDKMTMAMFGMTREQAHEKGVCIKCKETPELRTDTEKHEYHLSATCPTCWENLFPPEDEEEEYDSDDLGRL